MKAITCPTFGDASVMKVDSVPIPTLKEDEVLVKVEATGLNRADVLQRMGKYPPPRGESEIFGLECTGYLIENEAQVKDKNFKGCKRVMALLPGGGYGEFVAVNKNHLMELDDSMDFKTAAAITETFCTAY